MRLIICMVILIAFCPRQTHAQTFAANLPVVKNEITPAAPLAVDFIGYTTSHFQLNMVTKAGFIAMGAGAAIGTVGIIYFLSDLGNTSSNANAIANTGAVLAVSGFAILVAGSGMAIGGGIYNGISHRGNRYSIIAPKKNELGLAYNF